jgi:hypothetical protein
LGIKEVAHPVLVKCFSSDERDRLIREDFFAGKSVSLELVAVVALGLVGVIAVLSTI